MALQISPSYRIFIFENYLNKTTSDKIFSFDSPTPTSCFLQHVLPTLPSPGRSIYLSIISLLNHQFSMVMPSQSTYPSLAHHPFESYEIDQEHTSKVETRKINYQDSKEMVVTQLYMPLLSPSSKSDMEQ